MTTTATTKTTTTIDVPADDFRRHYDAMIRLLRTLHKHGGTMSTVRLYSTARMSNNYGGRMITKAAELGYVKRDKTPKPKGEKGADMMVNTLTVKGKQLLEKLQLA